jgi:hypothetical protein
VTGGTVTLTPVEYANTIQEYFGTLTSNCTIILPSTVQLYSVYNQTAGSFSLTFKTTAVGGGVFTVPTGQTALIVCDGTNVYSASTANIGVVSNMTLGAGSALSPSINFTGDTSTGIYEPTSGALGFALSGVNKMTLDANGLKVVNGIGGGVF